MTYTVVEMQLSPEAYAEIEAKLRNAGYDHAFMPDGLLDMTHIAVSCGIEEFPGYLPMPGSIWTHHSGRRYRVTSISNLVDTAKFPTTIHYVSLDGDMQGAKFSRSWKSFQGSFTPEEKS